MSAPAGLRPWRHELRGTVSAMAGWAMIFGQTHNPETHVRAVAAITHNAKGLARLLAHPPA